METQGERLKQWLTLVYGTPFRGSIALEMHPSALHNYTSGKHKPGSDILARLARLGCNINWLLTGEGAMFGDNEAGAVLLLRLGNTNAKNAGATVLNTSTGFAKTLEPPSERKTPGRR